MNIPPRPCQDSITMESCTCCAMKQELKKVTYHRRIRMLSLIAG